MKLNNLFVVAVLAATGSVHGMNRTGQVETKANKSQEKELVEEAEKTFSAVWRVKEAARIEATYEHFLAAVKKFKEERLAKSVLLKNAGMERVIDLGLVSQVRTLARTALTATDPEKKTLAKGRMETVITFAECLFESDVTQEKWLAEVSSVMSPYLLLSSSRDKYPSSRKLDGMWRELYKEKLFSEEEAELLADAFTGWLDILGK
jgi:hypothetical protein